MTEQEIIEGNKLIREFMGHGYYALKLQYHLDWNELMPVVEKIQATELVDGHQNKIPLRVDMCVDGKDSTYGIHCMITSYGLGHFLVPQFYQRKQESLIIATWKAIVQFIQWYNSQQSKSEKP